MPSSSEYPKFLGVHGKPLEWVLTAILTFGFVLVGYDQGKSLSANDALAATKTS